MNKGITLALALNFMIAAPAFAADYELTATASSMENHPVVANSLLPLLNLISERTDGKAKSTFFNPGTICPETEILSSIAKGIVDAGFSSVSRFPQKFTTTMIVEIPFFSENSRITAAALISYFEKSEILQNEYAEYKLLSITGSTPRDILSIKPIRSIKDLKGKKIGTSNATGSEVLALLGATPVVMPNNDMYMNLQRGMVDGVFMPIPTYKSLKITEVAKYLTKCNIAPSTTPFVMNKKKFESLPPEIQAEYNKLYPRPGTFHTSLWVDKSTHDDLKWIIENHQVQIIELSPEEEAIWSKALEPLTQGWKDKMAKRGLDGDKVYAELKEFIEYYSKDDMANWKAEYETYKDALGPVYTPLDF